MTELQEWELIENKNAELTAYLDVDLPPDGDDSIHEEDA